MIEAYACSHGVRHIVELRGDPDRMYRRKWLFAPHPGGYRNAADPVTGIKRIA